MSAVSFAERFDDVGANEVSPSQARAERPILEAIGLTKRFGAFTALNDVTIALMAGEFHALLGENGAGKSTLVKSMLGYYHPDAGAIVLDDREVTIANPRDARRLGIGMVYQHFTLVPAMTVLENLVMSRVDVPTVIDWASERKSKPKPPKAELSERDSWVEYCKIRGITH